MAHRPSETLNVRGWSKAGVILGLSEDPCPASAGVRWLDGRKPNQETDRNLRSRNTTTSRRIVRGSEFLLQIAPDRPSKRLLDATRLPR